MAKAIAPMTTPYTMKPNEAKANMQASAVCTVRRRRLGSWGKSRANQAAGTGKDFTGSTSTTNVASP